MQEVSDESTICYSVGLLLSLKLSIGYIASLSSVDCALPYARPCVGVTILLTFDAILPSGSVYPAVLADHNYR
jgi:hypothetical protein